MCRRGREGEGEWRHGVKTSRIPYTAAPASRSFLSITSDANTSSSITASISQCNEFDRGKSTSTSSKIFPFMVLALLPFFYSFPEFSFVSLSSRLLVLFETSIVSSLERYWSVCEKIFQGGVGTSNRAVTVVILRGKIS